MLFLGIIIAGLFVLFGIGGGGSGMRAIILFISPPSFLIVVCPALALILAAYDGKGLGLVFKAPFVRNMVKEDIKKCIKIYKDLRIYLIVSGFVGAVIGSVLMLVNLEDPDALGPGLALAILTILYGLLFGYFICYPIQRRLEQSEVD